MDDITVLTQAEESQAFSCIYCIGFGVKVKTNENDWEWVEDELHVRSTEDARVAIDRLSAWVHTPHDYGVEIKGFKVYHVDLLASSDL